MKRFSNLLRGTVAAVCLAAGLQAAAPIGTWSFNSNGFPARLVITSVNHLTGDVVGNMDGVPIKGFWNEGAQRLTFYRTIGGNLSSTPPENIQVYTGYKFPTSVLIPNGTKRLAGTFEAFRGTGANAVRSVFGWYAISITPQ